MEGLDINTVKAGENLAANPATFNEELRTALEAIPQPTDGKPTLGATIGGPSGLATLLGGIAKPRPCSQGRGTRGGKSTGKGSGRLRLWECKCEKPVKVRVARRRIGRGSGRIALNLFCFGPSPDPRTLRGDED